MHIRLLTVGERQPGWVDDAFNTYSGRFPREWRFRHDTIATARRSKNEAARRAIDKEGELLLTRVGAGEHVVLLDERGEHLNSKALARRLSIWQSDGRDLSFIIGGPDGVSTACHERANFTWALSDLTLPHGLARVLLAEQLYRAWSLQTGHPYHRD